MKFLINVFLGISLLVGIGLLTMENKLGIIFIVFVIFLSVFLQYKRNLIKKG